ncbi:hypothetical protein H6784_06055 [Candidatus Nomurabacteria bacterium]|nr:hypothetical protein [Candidatus Kaiserbacteria bacterium]MCB9811075.1 hypothetical protein [Candidatus Nomurabacteria bacterium]MCB9814935.1 hypothetical protein [Candidatus Nomurabacteria bacterium]
MNNLASKIIQKIKDGEVNMQPRWHFVFKTALMMVGIVIVSLVAVYLFSFVIFTLHKSGLWLAPQFGYRGMMMFVVGTPWLLLSILGLFILLLYILVSHFSFSYRKPLVYSMVGVVLFVIMVSSLIQFYGFHERMQSFSEQHHVPGLRSFYQDSDQQRPPGMVQGKIIGVRAGGFVLDTDSEEELLVDVSRETKMPPDVVISIGAEVLVFGERKEDTVYAFGVRPATVDNHRQFRPNMRRGDFDSEMNRPQSFKNDQTEPVLVNPVIE